MWVVAIGTALVVAATTRIGPTLAELTLTHGIHLGDLVFVAGAVVACTVVTWGRLRRR